MKKLHIYEFSQSITTLELRFKSNLFFLFPPVVHPSSTPTSFHNSSRSAQNYCRALNGIMLEKTSSEKIAKAPCVTMMHDFNIFSSLPHWKKVFSCSHCSPSSNNLNFFPIVIDSRSVNTAGRAALPLKIIMV
jgi:hypothetical protein